MTKKNTHEFKKKSLGNDAADEVLEEVTVDAPKTKKAKPSKKVLPPQEKKTKKSKKSKKEKEPKSEEPEVLVDDEEHEIDEAVDEVIDIDIEVDEVEDLDEADTPAEKVIEVESDEASMVLGAERIKDIDDDLREIYSDKDGLLPDMTTFETKKRSSVVRALLALILSFGFLAGVAWFGFFTFQPQARFSERDVIVSVRGPEEIAVGGDVRYRIKYTNDQSVPLTQATLQLRYPAGFVFVSSSIPSTSGDNDMWQLGSIDEQDGGVIEVYGRLYGDVGAEQSLRAFFNYTPANFSSEFQKVESARTLFAESPVQLKITGPETIGVGTPASWTIALEDLTDKTIVEVTLPEGFSLLSSEPESDKKSPRKWTIDPTTSSAAIVLEGVFEEKVSDLFTVSAFTLLDSDLGASLDRVQVAASSHDVAVSDTDIVANLLVNGVLGDFAMQAGETFSSIIVVQNTGELPMVDATVRFVVDSPSDGAKTIFSWADIVDEADGYIFGEQVDPNTRRATVTWNKAQVPGLRSIAPGEEVQIVFALPILNAEQMDLTTFETAIAGLKGEIQYTQDDARKTLSTNALDVTINSDLRLTTQDTLDTLGESGETHEVVYLLENSFHALTDISLTVDVYGDAVLRDIVVPAGEANYDEDAKTLTWNVDQMPLGVDVLALQFSIDLEEKNPSQSNLTSKVRIQATDSVTGEVMTIVGSEILLGESVLPDLGA